MNNYFGNYNPNYLNNYNKPPMYLRDYGSNPLVIDINKAALNNYNFRTTLWTGNHLQITLMNIIGIGESIG